MHHDAIVVGGSFAGLAAATYLARARRHVLVVDAGLPRNRFAAASHGFLGRDGKPPGLILDEARAQLLAYPTVDLVRGEAVAATGEDGGFVVRLADGAAHGAAKLVLAFGLFDALPEIAGVAERWGRSVLHCPYCHGIEFSDRPLGVLHKGPMSAHQAALIREWGPVTLFLNGATLEPDAAGQLARRGVAIEPVAIAWLEGAGADLAAVRLEDGRGVAIEALYVAPTSRLNSPLAEQLGCAVDEGPLGPVIRTDAFRMTTVPGVFAAGDIARAPHSVSWAVADGVTAGTSLHRALVFPALAA
jgi:thioredoxin reductase